MAGGAEPTIGIVGPHELVERIMLSGLPLSAGPGPAQASERGEAPTRRLVTAAYREEQEAPEKVARLGASVDACLFASRVPYEYARRAGVLTVPATYIQLSGSALYAAMLRASRDGHDIARSSIDVVSQADAEDAFGELGIATDGIHVREEVSGSRGHRRLPRAAVAPGRDRRRVHLPAVGGPQAGRSPGTGVPAPADRQRDPVRAAHRARCWPATGGWRTRSWPW